MVDPYLCNSMFVLLLKDQQRLALATTYFPDDYLLICPFLFNFVFHS